MLSVRSRMSISVTGDCGFVKTLLFGNVLQLGVCVSMGCVA